MLDDSGNGFRNDDVGVWQELLDNTMSDWLIVKMARPLASDKSMWDLARRGPRRPDVPNDLDEKGNIKRQYAPDRLIVVVNAIDLRDEGIGISERLSWERTAEDFVRELGSNGKLDTLATSAHLIVRFDCDGVIYHRGRSAEGRSLYFDRNHAEGEFVDAQGGRMMGMTAAFTAGLAATLAEARGTNDAETLRDGILAGMTAARRLAAAGFVKSDDHTPPDYPRAQAFPARPRKPHNTLMPVAIRSEQIIRGGRWLILDQTLGDAGNVARDVVRRGSEIALIQAPVAKFGELRTADRREIEGYRAIGNLLREYLARPRSKPISIGVFGPPGSGKSFGVEQVAVQVARAAAAGREVRKLEFNLSQYTSLEELAAAFHLVRDCSLSGRVPLAFFDEFDSDFLGKPLGWLRYFLSPMQSGTFSEGGHDHPIGSAIFVFAGGTRARLEDFSAPMAKPEGDKDRHDFAAVKGPDFASRLRGHVDIMGTNPAAPDDGTYPVRRAFVLRSIIERDYKQLLSGKAATAQIDDGVLNALLTMPAFRHGVRSMEAILAMSSLSRAIAFNRASLPPAEQLAGHVDADNFMRRVSGEHLDDDLREQIGRLLHGAYREQRRRMAKTDKQKAELRTDDAMARWSDLSAEFRESSRFTRADDIPHRVARDQLLHGAGDQRPEVGDRLREGAGRQAGDTRARTLQRRAPAPAMAPGPERPGAAHGPFLKPWRDLAEEWQDVDRNAVNAIFDVLHAVGWRVYRVDKP